MESIQLVELDKHEKFATNFDIFTFPFASFNNVPSLSNRVTRITIATINNNDHDNIDNNNINSYYYYYYMKYMQTGE